MNPSAPDVSLPFTMCHEMAHRMCIAYERDANFAAFLAAAHNPDVQSSTLPTSWPTGTAWRP